MKPLKISAVSYLNTFPFVYGLQQSGLLKDFSLEMDVPSVCAAKLKSGEVDIALVPVGAIIDFDYVNFVSDYCIGARNEVRTVLLLSQKPLAQISKIHLDFDSRTSVTLARVLAASFWKISPGWENTKFSPGIFEDHEAIVAIGDKTFELAGKYAYRYDLATEWIRYTSLPFVFAAWLSVKKQSEKRMAELNKALLFGIEHKKETLQYFYDKLPTSFEDALSYLENNISYELDLPKKKGLEKFLELQQKL